MTPKTATQYAEKLVEYFEALANDHDRHAVECEARGLLGPHQRHGTQSRAFRHAVKVLLADIPALKAAEDADINRRGREIVLAIESALTAEPLPSDVRRRLRNRLIYGNPEGMGASNELTWVVDAKPNEELLVYLSRVAEAHRQATPEFARDLAKEVRMGLHQPRDDGDWVVYDKDAEQASSTIASTLENLADRMEWLLRSRS